MDVQTIQVSDQTYALLQALARPFEDTKPEDVIVRLIREVSDPSKAEPVVRDRDSSRLGGRPLSSHSGSIPHGARLRATYKGQEYVAEVRDGYVIWNDTSYTSISAAAIGVIQSTGSHRGTENGWRFWEVQQDDGSWVPATEYQR